MDRSIRAFFRVAFVMFLSVVVMPVAAAAEESKSERVLLLYYDNGGNATMAVAAFDKGIRSVFGEPKGGRIELNVEYTDLSRNFSGEYSDELVDLLRLKYGQSPPDVILINMNPYADFLTGLCQELFPQAKLVFSLYDISFLDVLDRFPGRATGVYFETCAEETPALILQVLPETEAVYVIVGSANVEQSHLKRVKTIFDAYPGRFNTHYLIGTPLDLLAERLSSLPENSVIYFATYLEDVAGNPHLPHEVLPLISENANAPVFSFNDMYMGYGILGGKLISSEEIGRTIATLSLDLLNGESPENIAPVEVTGRYTFSWHQLKKWGIDEERLPPGSLIIDREVTFFEKYKRRILFWAGVTVLQFLLITYLFTLLALRKRSEEERERLEAALRQSQKMESIGTLAGGIAHDFNNILSAIIGYAELALLDLDAENPLRRNLRQILKGGERARDLVNQILTFARKAQDEPAQVQIRLVAEDVLKLLRSTIPTSIEIRKNLTSDSEILADRTRIHQIFLNVCTNAVQAMENTAGRLFIDVSDVVLINDNILPPGEYVKISISDTGSGIASDQLEQIFDPYFTTKGVGKGTGLGLSVVHGIVEGYGGRIMVDSELDRGTTFTIYLPISKSGPRGRERDPAPVQRGSESVLLVDDEQAIAEMWKRFLERQGYRVTIAADGAAALALFKEKPQSFDVVVTDMTMPRMNGDLLASELEKIRPEIPVILCTGYSDKVLAGEVVADRIQAVLMKPVSQKELSAAIRQALHPGK